MCLNRFMSCLVLAAFFGGPASAQTSSTEGLGGLPCARLTQALEEEPDDVKEFAIWISGYLNAANGYEADTFDLTPWQPLELVVSQIAPYCAANPQAPLAQAMTAYIRYLRPNRLKTEETVVSARHKEKTVFIYPSVLASVRDKLIEMSMLPATAAETYDEDTAKALSLFQAQRALPQTGLPDTATLMILLRDQ